MTWITVATAHEVEWHKRAALRAATTERVENLLDRFLTDLAALDAEEQPRFDYLEPGAMAALRSDPDTFHLVGRVAGTGAGQPACTTTTYWPDEEDAPVDVELEVKARPGRRHRVAVTVDPVLDRISDLELAKA